MRVAIVHDRLVTNAGAEKILRSTAREYLNISRKGTSV